MKKLLAILLFTLLAGTTQAHAAQLHGWAWSETFGWFSFNSTDTGAGGGPYAVSIDSSGNWGGYAWSEGAGWLSFNAADVSPCGAAGQLNKTTGAVTGWARLISFSGTDGCVELSGTNHISPSSGGSGGVTYDANSGVFKGYAWGADVPSHTGVGWLQFNPISGTGGPENPENPGPVKCFSGDCGYNGTISGTCTRNPSSPYFGSPTSVTFTAAATGGEAPIHYNWNNAGYDTQSPTNQFTASYTTSGPGPMVTMRDNGGLTSNPVSCPSVTVLAPLGSSNISVGRTVATANSTQLTIKQVNPFALKWNFTMSDDYSCSATVNPDPNNAIWNSNWKSISLNETDNGDGTKTWTGNTGTTLQAGTVAAPVTPGIYSFGVVCTSSATPTPNATQAASATLKIDSSAVKEI